MTVKRFTIDLEYDRLEDAKEVFPSICFTDGIDWYTVCEKLNELNDENEELKTQLQNTSDQRDEFHRGARENANRVGKLEKENEQLKSEIEKLSYANEDLLSEKRNWQRMSDEYCKLSEENEQLKQQLNTFKPIIFEDTNGGSSILYEKVEE